MPDVNQLLTNAEGYTAKAETNIVTRIDETGLEVPVETADDIFGEVIFEELEEITSSFADSQEGFADSREDASHANAPRGRPTSQADIDEDFGTLNEPHAVLVKIELNGSDSLYIDDSDPIENMTKLHYMAAYLYAKGNVFSVVSLATGLSVEILKEYVEHSNSFQQTIIHYRENPTEQPNFDPQFAANLILCEGVDELLRRVATDPSSFSNREIFQLIELMSTRTDLGLNPRESKKDEGVSDDLLERVKASKTATTGAVTIPNLEEALAARRNQVGGSNRGILPE